MPNPRPNPRLIQGEEANETRAAFLANDVDNVRAQFFESKQARPSLSWAEFEIYKQDFTSLDVNRNHCLDGTEVRALVSKQLGHDCTHSEFDTFLGSSGATLP